MKQKIIAAFMALCAYAAQAQVTVEAESATLTGTEVQTDGAIKYVGGLDNDGDMFTNAVTLPEAGFYTIAITYRGSGQKVQHFLVNDGVYADVTFPSNTSWATVLLNSVYFKAGANTFSIKKFWGFNDFDKFTLTKQNVAPHDYSTVTNSLINAKADDNTKALYSFLLQNYGKYMLSGQTSDYYDKVVDITKKHPIIRTFDMQSYCNHYPYGWNNTTATFDWRSCKDDGTIKKAIDWYNATNKKGIVALQWHWCSPMGGTVGTNTFSTTNTNFDITKAITPGTDEYKATIRDIDSVATYLLQFKKAGVPILWRPLHEAGGGWFWWGAKGAAPCKALWDTIYNRMVNKYELNNMIWVWSTPEKDWFVGNDKFDILGYDSYPGAYQYTAQKPMFEQLFELCGGKKLVTLSENGPIPNPQDCFDMDARWAYFMSWDSWLIDENSTDHIKDVYVHPRVLSLEDLDKLTQNTPSIVFRSPDNAKYYVEGAAITVTAVPFSPNSTIDSVVFLVDGIRKAVSTSLPMANFTFEALANGSHTITIRTYDADKKMAEAECTQTIVALNDVVVTISPKDASILPSASQVFSLSLANKSGNSCEGANFAWNVSGGGAITKLSGSTAKFTPSATSGTFTISATQGAAQVSTTVEISDCPISKIPNAANWITRNGWNDQTNGSLPVQSNDALLIKARKWGKKDLLAVQNGSKISLIKDSSYIVSFDFLNDATYPLTTMDMSLATAWNNEAVTSLATQKEQITAPTAATFTRISKTFVATASTDAYLALALTWSAQPNDTARLTIKNLQICQLVQQATSTPSIASAVLLHPNPARSFVTIQTPNTTINGTIVAVSQSGQRSTLSYDKNGDEHVSVFVSQLANGAYMLEIPTIDGLLHAPLFIVR